MEQSGGVNVFVANHSHEYQLSFLDKDNDLTEREKRFLNPSWSKYSIFPKIDKKPYAVLYSEQSSRPNTPVNVILEELLIKELSGLSDEDMVTGLMFDIRHQYALHMTSFTEQPLSNRTLGCFRARCTAYKTKTGTDLIKNTVTQLSKELAEMMKIDTSFKRMDSMMVASNIKKMGKLELLYTCVANLAKEQTIESEEGELRLKTKEDGKRGPSI